jgi:hypothetical protein
VRSIVTTDIDGLSLQCPCKGERSDRLHPVAVRVHRGSEDTTITSFGTKVTPARPRSSGVHIDVVLDGECGHRIHFLLKFHQGFTIVEASPHDDGEAMNSRRAPFLSVIWRSP